MTRKLNLVVKITKNALFWVNASLWYLVYAPICKTRPQLKKMTITNIWYSTPISKFNTLSKYEPDIKGKTHDFYFLYFQELVISQNFSGHLVAHSDWPTPLKNKGVFFIKREMKPLPKENFLNELTCGDIHPNALDHFCAWVEEVKYKRL